MMPRAPPNMPPAGCCTGGRAAVVAAPGVPGCVIERLIGAAFGAVAVEGGAANVFEPREPALVRDCVVAMREAVAHTRAAVTVKCRIGVDEQDEYAGLAQFVDEVHASGCDVFIVHARKAWLKGLSPKENREVPPLNYQRVYRLKQEHPQLAVVINGGIATVAEVQEHLRHVDGAMLGRTAYHEPYRLAEIEHALHGTPLPDRDEVLQRLRPYIESHLARGDRLQHITRHILGLYQGLPGARAFRRTLSEQAHRADAGWEVVEQAIAARRGELRNRAA
jgi:tRNA-dihydrouridine synthase A